MSRISKYDDRNSMSGLRKDQMLTTPKWHIASMQLKGKQTYTYYFMFEQKFKLPYNTTLTEHIQRCVSVFISKGKLEEGIERLLNHNTRFQVKLEFEYLKDKLTAKLQHLNLIYSNKAEIHFKLWRTARAIKRPDKPIAVVEVCGQSLQVLPDNALFAQVFGDRTATNLNKAIKLGHYGQYTLSQTLEYDGSSWE